MSNTNTTRSSQLKRRSALIGGAMIWTAPIVQSIGGSALAATTSPQSGGGGGAPSYTLLVLFDGVTYLRVKIDQSGSVSCGKAANVGGPAGASAVTQIDAQLAGATTWSALGTKMTCPAGLSATVTAAGLQVVHTGYTVAAWSVHDGADAGCAHTSFGPGNGGSPAYVPAIGGSSSLFPKPKVTVCPL